MKKKQTTNLLICSNTGLTFFICILAGWDVVQKLTGASVASTALSPDPVAVVLFSQESQARRVVTRFFRYSRIRLTIVAFCRILRKVVRARARVRACVILTSIQKLLWEKNAAWMAVFSACNTRSGSPCTSLPVHPCIAGSCICLLRVHP